MTRLRALTVRLREPWEAGDVAGQEEFGWAEGRQSAGNDLSAALVITDEDIAVVERAMEPPLGALVTTDGPTPERQRAIALLLALGYELP